MIALGMLAAAAAVVSFQAQYRMVFAAKGVRLIAALEAGIPDVAAIVFASLGIALALHGKRAVRARVLNVASVAASIGMNVLAAGSGWRDLAIWALPPVAYALASDTAIGVIRSYTIARQRSLSEDLADDEVTPLAMLGGLVLWWLRLAVAPVSTLAGFRSWVVEECPVAPGRRAVCAPNMAALPAAPDTPGSAATSTRPARPRGTRRASKTAQFIELAVGKYGPLEAFPLERVSPVASELAPQVGLDTGSARTALRARVLTARDGGTR
jgi:hypothetical protein